MSVETAEELEGIQSISRIVAEVLRDMRKQARAGMSTLALDELGGRLLAERGARSAPKLAYRFPGHTCISINEEAAHGIPSARTILAEGDLINIDVSAERNGFWADNGGSFVLGEDVHRHRDLVLASRRVLLGAIKRIRGGVRVASLGKWMETEATRLGFRVLRNLAGHGVGRALHEEPTILNCYDPQNKQRFRRNSVVAVETFVSTRSDMAIPGQDDWTLFGNRGGFVAQHEHTILITDRMPVILTAANQI